MSISSFLGEYGLSQTPVLLEASERKRNNPKLKSLTCLCSLIGLVGQAGSGGIMGLP